MLDLLKQITPLQWGAIVGAILLVGWSHFERLPSLLKRFLPGPSPEPLPPSHSVLSDVVCLRSHLASHGETAAIKSLDEVVIPACVRVASEATHEAGT